MGPRQPNLEEVLTDGDNALLFDPQADGGLEAALGALCHDTALRERIAAGSARSIARLGLTWRANAQRVARLSEALKERRPLPAAVLGSTGAP